MIIKVRGVFEISEKTHFDFSLCNQPPLFIKTIKKIAEDEEKKSGNNYDDVWLKVEHNKTDEAASVKFIRSSDKKFDSPSRILPLHEEINEFNGKYIYTSSNSNIDFCLWVHQAGRLYNQTIISNMLKECTDIGVERTSWARYLMLNHRKALPVIFRDTTVLKNIIRAEKLL